MIRTSLVSRTREQRPKAFRGRPHITASLSDRIEWHLLDKRLLVDLNNMRVSVAAAGLPGRYAAALFDLAQSSKALAPTAKDLAALKAALSESADLRLLTSSPGISRDDAGKAISALASALGLSDLTGRFLGVLAENGRLSLLGDVIRAFENMLAAHKGATTAHVTSAHKLTAAQKKAIEAKLKARTGQTIEVDLHVDPSILGGLVVRIGSEQIDSSIKARLERLGQQMKGL